MSERLEFSINGRPVREDGVRPTTTVLRYLRDNLHLMGTKEGCAEGDCGACTVVVVDPNAEGGPTFRAVNSCLVLLPMVQGKDVYTVEGLAEADALHPVQRKLVEELGSQCGYCTPGVIMSMFEACYRGDLDEPWKIDDQLCGNLCRCTGYRPIRDATRAIAGLQPKDRFADVLDRAPSRSMKLSYRCGDQRFFTPTSYDELWEILDEHPEARFVVGGTDLSLEITKRFEEPQLLVSLEGIEDLHSLTEEDGAWIIGSAATLSRIERLLAHDFPAIERMLRFFGARQIKNRGTIGGNLCTASPIGDLAPVLLSLNASVRMRSRDGSRELAIADFFQSYRKTALGPKEILDAVIVPKLDAEADVRSTAYKVSKRQELDISTVSAGCYVRLDSGIVKEARFGFGGMSATPARAKNLEAALSNQPWTEASVEAALPALDADFRPIDDHRGSAWYRSTVAKNLVRGFFLETEETAQPRHAYRPTGTLDPEVNP